jgi:AmmeMemoRadiSam system protein A
MVPHPPLIVPAVGRGREEKVAATVDAYRKVARKIAELKPDTIIISSPHAPMYADYFHISPGSVARGDLGDFNAPEISFEVDQNVELISAVAAKAWKMDFPAGTASNRSGDVPVDHGIMVPLWFINQYYSDFSLMRIGLSGLRLWDHYRLGELVAGQVERLGIRAVWVASGDLSHKLKSDGPYGFAPEGPVYDKKIMDAAGRAAFGEFLDFDEEFCDRAAECGHRSFVMMAGSLDGLKVKSEVLSYEDVTGVGYGICCFYPEGEDDSRHFLQERENREIERLNELNKRSDPFVELARQTIETFVSSGNKISVPSGFPDEITSVKAGCFVSIHKQGRLRGCIGTIAPIKSNLAEEIIDNAVSAAARDPRFEPVAESELKWLEINVDVLSEPEDISSPDELDVKRYGVIVTCGGKRGLLLPDLDGVDTVEDQINIARRKAGIGEHEQISLKRFEVVRHR